MFIYKYKKIVLASTLFIAILAVFFATKVTFVFDFERFFPKGDKDLDYFYDFREAFEDDDNFLLIAFSDSQSIFKQDFLQKLDHFTKESAQLPNVLRANSITNFKYFVKLGFGGFSPPYPAVNIDKPKRLKSDSTKLFNDERVLGNMISKDGKSAIITLKTKNSLTQEEAEDLMADLAVMLANEHPDSYHLLGKASFQVALVKQQIKEFVVSTLIAALLVTFVFWLIFKRVWAVIVALISMTLCLLLFVGLIGFLGIELDLLSSLFPIVIIIVGISDVVHLSNKYIHEYNKLGDKKQAIIIAIKEIGLATFLTSFTTAIGFLSLMTSKILPVKNFGMTAAMGVIVAYLIVITFTAAFLASIPAEKIIAKPKSTLTWNNLLRKLFFYLRPKGKAITLGAIVVFIFCMAGIYKITTDVKIYDTLPAGLKVTNDFNFFEEKYTGFRPFEIAITVKDDYSTNDFNTLQQVDKLERYIKESAIINGVNSYTDVYKTMNRAFNADRSSFYVFPEKEREFNKMRRFVEKIPDNQLNVLVNEEKKKLRISAKVKDVGTDKVDQLTKDINTFIAAEIDTSIISAKITGTGVIFDKNNVYVRQSLISGLSLAFFIISVLMALLFKDIKMVIISLVPNVFPLLFGGALLGFLNIALDAPTAIIFAISFGIAVDDSIHFLSKFKLERLKNKNIEDSLEATFIETGKSIIVTSIILFFGFMILLFSKTPGIVSVGILVSFTLFSALLADLALIPLLIRKLIKD